MRKIKPMSGNVLTATEKKVKTSIFNDCDRIVSSCKERGYQVSRTDAYIIFTDHCYRLTKPNFEWLPLPVSDETLVRIILKHSIESDD